MVQTVGEDGRGQAGAGALEDQPVRCPAGRILAGGGGDCPKGGGGVRGEPVGSVVLGLWAAGEGRHRGSHSAVTAGAGTGAEAVALAQH